MSTASPSAPPAGAPRAPATSSRLWGPLLIGLGVLLLARQLLPIDLSDLVVGALLVVGGLFFLGAYGRDPANWVLLIPGIALCVLGLGRAIGSVAPRLGQAIGGSFFMVGLGLAFLVAYAADRAARWWAVIPAGALLGIGAGNLVQGFGGSGGGWLFVGLGLAFLWLAARAERPWAIWPAGILLLLGLNEMRGLLGFGWPRAFAPLPGLLWPVALIALGAWLLLTRSADKEG